jgi:hypothetical protein
MFGKAIEILADGKIKYANEIVIEAVIKARAGGILIQSNGVARHVDGFWYTKVAEFLESNGYAYRRDAGAYEGSHFVVMNDEGMEKFIRVFEKFAPLMAQKFQDEKTEDEKQAIVETSETSDAGQKSVVVADGKYHADMVIEITYTAQPTVRKFEKRHPWEQPAWYNVGAGYYEKITRRYRVLEVKYPPKDGGHLLAEVVANVTNQPFPDVPRFWNLRCESLDTPGNTQDIMPHVHHPVVVAQAWSPDIEPKFIRERIS